MSAVSFEDVGVLYGKRRALEPFTDRVESGEWVGLIGPNGAGKSSLLRAALGEADAIIFGTPTRFGNMCGQMRQFLDSTGQLWMNGTLVGKVGSVITSSNTQHGGQESTILSFHTTLLHQGMIIVGLPYAFKGQMTMNEISGCSPYGASTIAGGDGSRVSCENELAGARFQGEHVARIVKKLTA